ncbi:choice-of-anchor Q domain-containing protein [Wenzhouxiangella sediminis]|uniref:CSLREA domain-containing protein n=1 Tax=Wenzhouxiangella sediminis TaxID=1792836 RepID=A0A3E1K523_9GAMM|nr:choice-of-anchor Q domain-containing protein [Wenzhouxiangella sediminis]RFF29143.1 hypothetical protein DZC52_14935 [Wenzhouxiangella sediminis]
MVHGIGQGPSTARAIAVSTALCLALAAAQATADTLTVDTSLDVAAEDGHCSLREAIINANAGDQSGSSDCRAGTGPADSISDTITFSPALDGNPIVLSIAGAGENEAATGDLDISDLLMIEGNGPDRTIIDADGIDRVIEVRDDEAALTTMSLRLAGITLRNGSVEAPGGGILSLGASTSLLIEDCVIENNTALGAATSALGGGVLTEGPAAITASRISGNLASASGGLIAAGGGLAANNNLLLRQVVLEGNRAESVTGAARGGGVLATPGGGPVLVQDTIIRGNEAEGGEAIGGGLFAQDLPSLFFQAGIERSEITGNTAIAPGGISAGGGIYIGAPGGLTVLNITVSGNSVGGGVSASAAGGGIAVNEAGLLMNNSTVADNSVSAGPDAEGGGLYVEGGGAVVNMANSILAANTASEGGAPDCRGSTGSYGHNLLGSNAGCPGYSPGSGDIIGDVAGGGTAVDPALAPLADNGGRSRTMGLQMGSPAIDAGNPDASGAVTEICRESDQRNVARPFDGDDDGTAVCDIGAFELSAVEIFRDRFEEP